MEQPLFIGSCSTFSDATLRLLCTSRETTTSIDKNCRNRTKQAFSPRIQSLCLSRRHDVHHNIHFSVPVPRIQVPCSAHNQIIHTSADSERFLTHIHDRSSKSQEISTDQQGVTLIEETSAPPSPNVHLSASHVSSISCLRPTRHQSEPATQMRQTVSMIPNPRSDLDSLHSVLSIADRPISRDSAENAGGTVPVTTGT